METALQGAPKREQSDREAILADLRDSIGSIRNRIQDMENEEDVDQQVLIKWYRTLGYLSGQ